MARSIVNILDLSVDEIHHLLDLADDRLIVLLADYLGLLDSIVKIINNENYHHNYHESCRHAEGGILHHIRSNR